MILLAFARDVPALRWWKDFLVEYYGTPTPLMQLASISVPEPRSLMIKPFDAIHPQDDRKGDPRLGPGLNPNTDGKVIHLNLPPLTEERRRDLVKHMHHRLEEARVAVRNIRRDLHNDMRDFEKEKLISEDDLETRRGRPAETDR